jgi:hypothetical protein
MLKSPNKLALLGIVVIKIVVVVYLGLAYAHFPTEKGRVGFANIANDTSGYLNPCESVAQGAGYSSACRMPAFLPIYTPVSALFGPNAAMQMIILFQIILSLFSAWAVYFIIKYFTGHSWFSVIGSWIYAVSFVIAPYDLILLADSLGISLFILSIGFLVKFKISGSSRYILFSSILLVWSIFFRQIHVVFVPILFLWMLSPLNLRLKRFVRPALVFALPFVLFFGAWTGYNYMKSKRAIILVAPFDECYGYMPKQLIQLRDLVIAWGEDCQPWVPNSASNFFVAKNGTSTCPVNEKYFTSAYGKTELDSLRSYYKHFYFEKDSILGPESAQRISELAPHYLETYKREHRFDYYVLNRIKLMRQFMFPKRIDNIPGPALEQMNIIQKGVKLSAYLLFILVNVIAVLGTLIWVVRIKENRWFLALPWILVFVLAGYLGFIEQRYFAPIHALFIILDVVVIHYLWGNRKQRIAVK